MTECWTTVVITSTQRTMQHNYVLYIKRNQMLLCSRLRTSWSFVSLHLTSPDSIYKGIMWKYKQAASSSSDGCCDCRVDRPQGCRKVPRGSRVQREHAADTVGRPLGQRGEWPQLS